MMGGAGGMEADGKRWAKQKCCCIIRSSGVSSETHLARREQSWMPSLWGGRGGAGPPAAGSTADRTANSLLERSAVADGEPKGPEKVWREEKSIKPSGGRHGRSSAAHLTSFVQRSSSSSSSSLLSLHSWASTISISAAQARQKYLENK